jgi:hypothetical protein
MPDPSRGQPGRDVHRGYKCFDSGDNEESDCKNKEEDLNQPLTRRVS